MLMLEIIGYICLEPLKVFHHRQTYRRSTIPPPPHIVMR